MSKLENIAREYFEVLNQQNFVEAELDYSIFEKQIPFLNQMAQVNNSGLSVFDLHKKEHIYNSYNLNDLFGYDMDGIDTDYYNSKVHPDDLITLMEIGAFVIKHSYELPIKDRKNYKLQNEYRILNSQDKYVRIIEQFQILELDKRGNFWLAISTMDLSPNQEEYNHIRSQWVNIKTGEAKVIKLNAEKNTTLSGREREVLSFVKDGLLSKEISEKLFISLHTVNTHRQNILKKLSVNNSFEAIQYARKLDLI